jgi:hypothetical protein
MPGSAVSAPPFAPGDMVLTGASSVSSARLKVPRDELAVLADRRGSPIRLDTVKATALPDWPTDRLTPVLIDGGFGDPHVPIPWWDDRILRYRFPPR